MSANGDAIWLAMGWTMLHFLWVGGLIGLAAAMALKALDGASAEVRYGVALAGLAMLALAPAVIGWRAGRAEGGVDRSSPEPVVRVLPSAPPPRVDQVEYDPATIGRKGLAEPADVAVASTVVDRSATAPRPSSPASRLDALASRLPWLWLVGSPITFAWLALGLAGAERLRRHGAVMTDGDLPPLCRRLSRELGIARDVAVAVCERLAAPVLVGVVRPLILLPAAGLSGWSPDQLEMVLLHELAHVRRWDNLVNLLQRLIESALFFHPAVWIVSGWVRREREHCCDGIVVARTGRARAYAETLLALADPGTDRAPHADVALAGNDLVARVRRILDLHPEGHAMKLPRGLLALTAAILIFPAGWTISRARHAGPPGEVPAKMGTEATDPEIDLHALVARAKELAEAAANTRRDPKQRVRSLLDLGASMAQGGDRTGGVAVLHQAGESIKGMEEGRDRVIATQMLAERLALAGEADEAIAMASSLDEDAEGMAKVRSAALHTIAWYLAAAGDVAKAIEAARGIRDKSLVPYTLGTIAEAQARQGDAAAAMRTVESIEATEARIRALVGTSSGREHPGLAVARGRAGDRAGAREYLDRARVLAPTLPAGPKQAESLASIALAEAQLGDVAGGLRQIRALSESETRDTALGQMALLQAESGAWDDAYRTARSVPDPEHRFSAIFQLGEAQVQAGKRDDARQTFRKLLEANAGPKPLTTDVRSIARAQIHADDLTAALATIERMGVPDAQLIGEVAAAQAEAGDYAGARMTVAERIPDDAEKANAYAAIAYHQARAGRATEALLWAESLDHRLHRSAALMGVATAVAERRGVPLDQLQAPLKKEGANEKDATQRAMIQGKSVDQWLAALKDRDPAVRTRAVEVLGEYALGPNGPAVERVRLQAEVRSLMFSDKDPAVREAAGFISTLQSLAGSPERLKQAIDERKRAVKPTRTPIRLVDAQGRPVAGAVASDFMHRDADHDPSFAPSEPTAAPTSDARGELTLTLDIPSHRDATAVYAIRRDGDTPLVGLHRVTSEDIRGGKPITVAMQPACRVRLRVECPGFRELSEKFHVDLGGAGWWRAAYVWLGDNHRAARPLFASSTTGELEFLLPAGRYMIMAYGSDVNNVERVIEVRPGHRVLGLGALEVSPSDAIKQGKLRGFWRSIRRERPADPNAAAGEPGIVYRRPRSGVLLKGEARDAQDVACSPDGRLLATAHSYNADPGEVKLWDMTTGAQVATWPVRDRAVRSLAFSPDGKLLAGRVYAMANTRPSSEVVLWDVASRREARTLGGPAIGITTMAFAPDGRALATCGPDRAVRFWDVSSGREVRRIDGIGTSRAMAFSPDGRTLVMNGAGGALIVWDIAGNRTVATLEPEAEKFGVRSLAFAPDGRSLAAAGTVPVPDGQGQLGRARLYDLTSNPPARRAELVHDREGPGGPDLWTSDVAFTPDGRRVVGALMSTIAIWDAATGAETDSLDRGVGSSDDRLAVSPDGRWLAITQPVGVVASILDISPTGP